MNDSGLRGLFCLAVAASAATLTDPLLEAASNAGWFGPGNYTDRSTLDVLPALAVAVLLALAHVYLTSRPALASRSLAFARRLRASLATASPRLSARLLPRIFAVQLAVLYGMETGEQIVVTGHPLGGALWLGAPVALALAFHAAACVLCAFALTRILHGLTRVTVALAVFVHERHGRLAGAALDAGAIRRAPPAGVSTNPLAARLGKRAPPLFLA
jgi:hypothetical protein